MHKSTVSEEEEKIYFFYINLHKACEKARIWEIFRFLFLWILCSFLERKTCVHILMKTCRERSFVYKFGVSFRKLTDYRQKFYQGKRLIY
ncbi:MAG: hypothetical protein CMO81_04885 [Waddliaceae bacterium]|nr:hypothetical protein [Waddliaceae bacterium]